MAEQQVDDPLVGKVLNGRFEIIEPLGVGGMGRVYKAVQQPLDRIVALKVLNPRYDGARDPGFEKRFFLEASMTAKLKHPNTITVHDYGRTDDGIYFIAMEYLEGETLLHSIQQTGPLSWPRVLFIGAQVARSLREAHKLGLVHRDLKPANIMLMSEGTAGDAVKVLDFGLVKSFTPDAPKGPESTELTQAGVLLGSPMYMAPEQARNEADQRTDIYALGIVMFQAIAGRPPFVSKESIDIIVKHIREAPPELRSLVPEVPLEVNALVMKCLEKNPDARFQTMDEVLDAMRSATAGQGMSGIFADPRAASGTIPRTSTPGALVEQATPAVGETSIPVEVTDSGLASRPSRKGLIAAVAAIIVTGGAIGGALAWRAASSETPKPAIIDAKPTRPEPTKPVEPVKPAAVEVRFEVSSEPPGASVTRDGAVVGTTPFTLTVARTDASPVQVELAFLLDGYQDATVVAQGLEGTVPVKQALTKKAVVAKPPKTKKPPKKDPDGYKDDPYQ